LSEEGKAHGRKMEEYNKQASEFIFRENNANGRVEADTIDLHGQFVEEAEEILEERIRYAKAHGQNHLHVYVGPDNPQSPLFRYFRESNPFVDALLRIEVSFSNIHPASSARATTLPATSKKSSHASNKSAKNSVCNMPPRKTPVGST
jgi:hypothetical protein